MPQRAKRDYKQIMKAKVIDKGDSYGYGKTWLYRGCYIVYGGSENWITRKEDKILLRHGTRNFQHAKHYIDIYLENDK